MVPRRAPSPATWPTSAELPAGAGRVVISVAVIAFVSACAGPAADGNQASRPVASVTSAAPASPTASLPGLASPATASSSPVATPFDPATFVPPKVSASALRKQFAYDRTAPLHVQPGATRSQNGVRIQSITYAVTGGPPVAAEIVTPARDTGRHPGVVLAHGGALDPDAFLADATALAGKGIVSILPDIPMTILGNARTDLAFVTRSVVSERRALDVLVARGDVDGARLGFVGHSWGADLAAIMAGVEPRLRAVAVVCGWSRMATDMISMGGPADQRAYMSVVSSLDGYRYVAMPGARKIIIQYGRQDPNIPTAQRTELTRSSAGSMTRKDYDAGHDLINFAPAATDRQSFLAAALTATR